MRSDDGPEWLRPVNTKCTCGRPTSARSGEGRVTVPSGPLTSFSSRNIPAPSPTGRCVASMARNLNRSDRRFQSALRDRVRLAWSSIFATSRGLAGFLPENRTGSAQRVHLIGGGNGDPGSVARVGLGGRRLGFGLEGMAPLWRASAESGPGRCRKAGPSLGLCCEAAGPAGPWCHWLRWP
jgi:hypothetical protein